MAISVPLDRTLRFRLGRARRKWRKAWHCWFFPSSTSPQREYVVTRRSLLLMIGGPSPVSGHCLGQPPDLTVWVVPIVAIRSSPSPLATADSRSSWLKLSPRRASKGGSAPPVGRQCRRGSPELTRRWRSTRPPVAGSDSGLSKCCWLQGSMTVFRSVGIPGVTRSGR